MEVCRASRSKREKSRARLTLSQANEDRRLTSESSESKGRSREAENGRIEASWDEKISTSYASRNDYLHSIGLTTGD
jgi:hypothetical protein